jgi:hypothetical protein
MAVPTELPGGLNAERITAISADSCARINALLKYSHCKMYLYIDEYKDHGRVMQVVPDYEHPGYVIATCSTAFHGDTRVQAGNATGFVFRFL